MTTERLPQPSLPTRAALCAALLLVPLSLPAAVHAKDCGDRPTGKNPSIAELDAAIDELSMAFQVPTEIIKAVSHRESGTQQWRPNGDLVVNETDCGFGMMQLTGATAEQFDVPRLKSDWRYNLEAGVTVLQTKWKRGLRTHWKGKPLPEPDPAILENWYYALSLYQGKRTGEYPGKVFDHLAKRPGKLSKLLKAPVEVSNPDNAIPGFEYGKKYTALPEGFVFEDGTTQKAKTTRGSIGDPELAAQLDQVLERAERALEKDQVRRAIRYLQIVVTQQPDGGPGRKAKGHLDALDQLADAGVADGEAKVAAGDVVGGLIAYDAVEKRYFGLAAAERASQLAAAIREDPSRLAEAKALEAETEARHLLQKAERAAGGDDLREQIRLLKRIAKRYGGTQAGAEAQNRLRELEDDPDVQAKLAQVETEKKVQRALGRARSFANMRRWEQAAAAYQEVLDLVSEGPLYDEAKKGFREAIRKQ